LPAARKAALVLRQLSSQLRQIQKLDRGAKGKANQCEKKIFKKKVKLWPPPQSGLSLLSPLAAE
jgi:hypothetical protein